MRGNFWGVNEMNAIPMAMRVNVLKKMVPKAGSNPMTAGPVGFAAKKLTGKFAIAALLGGAIFGFGKGVFQDASPYIRQYVSDVVGEANTSIDEGRVNTNRDGWVGTKGSRAPLNATGDLALAMHRNRRG